MNTRNKVVVLIMLAALLLSAVAVMAEDDPLSGPPYPATLHEPHVDATNPGFGDVGSCPTPPAGQESWYGWHFVTRQNANFLSLTVTFENAGTFSADPFPGTVFVAHPDNSHAYIWTPGPDKLLAGSATLDQNSSPFNLSHICAPAFVPDPAVTVAKTAFTSYTREHFWDIAKKVETENGEFVNGTPKIWLDGPGSAGDETATWIVDVTYGGFVDKDFLVWGAITVTNTGNIPARVNNVSDHIETSQDIIVTVSCPTLPAVLLPGEDLECTYSSALPDKTPGTNFAAASGDFLYPGESVHSSFNQTGTAPITFGAPTPEINKTVTITDTNAGFAAKYGVVVLDAANYFAGQLISFNYSEDFAWEDYSHACGQGFIYHNIARVIGDNDVVLDEDDATLKVNVRCEILDVSKTAVTYFEREHFWDIDKSVETEEGHELEDGTPKIWLYTDGSGDETATWTIDVSYEGYEDSAHNVSGVITIVNTGQLDAEIVSVVDTLFYVPEDESSDNAANVAVDCGDEVSFPHTLAVGETLECTYSFDLDDKATGENTVTVTTERDTYGAEAAIVWGDPDNEFYATVTITDTNPGFAEKYGEVELDAADYEEGEGETFTYDQDFAYVDYDEDGCGSFAYDNTATIVETEQSASATLKVNVQCVDFESAWAKGDPNVPFCDYFANWGWTNPILPGTYEMELWAAAGQCDTEKGTLVGTVTVVYNGGFSVTFNLEDGYLLEETHVYAGSTRFPQVQRGRNTVDTVAPGQYYIEDPLSGDIYVIAHAVVGIPDPDFGP